MSICFKIKKTNKASDVGGQKDFSVRKGISLPKIGNQIFPVFFRKQIFPF